MLESSTNTSLQKSLMLSYNRLTSLPDDLTIYLPNLEVLDVSYNLLEFLQPDLGNIKDLDATGNPLGSILPAYRSDKEKVTLYYFYIFSCFILSCYIFIVLFLL